jgi:hypothetical protein
MQRLMRATGRFYQVRVQAQPVLVPAEIPGWYRGFVSFFGNQGDAISARLRTRRNRFDQAGTFEMQSGAVVGCERGWKAPPELTIQLRAALDFAVIMGTEGAP